MVLCLYCVSGDERLYVCIASAAARSLQAVIVLSLSLRRSEQGHETHEWRCMRRIDCYDQD